MQIITFFKFVVVNYLINNLHEHMFFVIIVFLFIRCHYFTVVSYCDIHLNF